MNIPIHMLTNRQLAILTLTYRETAVTVINAINTNLNTLAADIATQLQQTTDAANRAADLTATLAAKVDALNLAEAENAALTETVAALQAELVAVTAPLDGVAARLGEFSTQLRADDPAPAAEEPVTEEPTEPAADAPVDTPAE